MNHYDDWKFRRFELRLRGEFRGLPDRQCGYSNSISNPSNVLYGHGQCGRIGGSLGIRSSGNWHGDSSIFECLRYVGELRFEGDCFGYQLGFFGSLGGKHLQCADDFQFEISNQPEQPKEFFFSIYREDRQATLRQWRYVDNQHDAESYRMP